MNETNGTTIQLDICTSPSVNMSMPNATPNNGMDGDAVATDQQKTSAASSSTEVVAIADTAMDTARPNSTAADSQRLKNCESSKESTSSQKLIWAASNSPNHSSFPTAPGAFFDTNC